MKSQSDSGTTTTHFTDSTFGCDGATAQTETSQSHRQRVPPPPPPPPPPWPSPTPLLTPRHLLLLFNTASAKSSLSKFNIQTANICRRRALPLRPSKPSRLLLQLPPPCMNPAPSLRDRNRNTLSFSELFVLTHRSCLFRATQQRRCSRNAITRAETSSSGWYLLPPPPCLSLCVQMVGSCPGPARS